MVIDRLVRILKDQRILLMNLSKEWRMLKVYNGNIRFHNWFECVPVDNWLHRFCLHRGIEGKISFCSVFGQPNFVPFVRGCKVFFSGENLHGLWNRFNRFRRNEHRYDLILGFDPLLDDRHMRFPLWIQYLVAPEDDLEDIREKIARINDIANRTNPERTQFACIMARHDGSGIRSVLGDLLEPIAPITYPARFRNNTDELKTKYGDDKKKYLRGFRFNVCPENSVTLGYVTEKLFEAFMSGCIPIYWGASIDMATAATYKEGMLSEADIVDERAFLRFDENNPEALRQQVNELEHNRDAYKAFIAIPPFKEGAAERIWACLQELEQRLINLSNK